MGAVTKVIQNNKTSTRRGRTEIHRDQAIVERCETTESWLNACLAISMQLR